MEQKENKMGVMPVDRLLISMSLPMMISMLVQALYNVVDSMFVARVSENALTALSMAFPIQNLMIAVSTGLGVGLNAVLSRALGAKDEKGVNRAATNGIMLLFICGLVFMLGGATIVRPYFEMQTDIAEIVESGVDYTTIVMLGSMGIFMQILFERLLQSTGRTLLTMVSQGVGAIANIILDPIFIFGLFGVPKMGVAGAAIATISSQAVSAILTMRALMRTEECYKFVIKKLRVDFPLLGRILRIGFPAGIQSMMYSISNLLIQPNINALGTDTMAAWTAFGKVDSIIWMVMGAFSVSVTTFVGQNWGAGKVDRVKTSIRTGMVVELLSTLIMSGVILLTGQHLIRLFTQDEGVIAISLMIMHCNVPLYVSFVPIDLLSGGMRGMGNSLAPMLIICFGVCIFRVVWLFTAVPLNNNIITIVLSYPISWILTSIVMIIYYLHWSKKAGLRTPKASAAA